MNVYEGPGEAMDGRKNHEVVNIGGRVGGRKERESQVLRLCL